MHRRGVDFSVLVRETLLGGVLIGFIKDAFFNLDVDRFFEGVDEVRPVLLLEVDPAAAGALVPVGDPLGHWGLDQVRLGEMVSVISARNVVRP